jgi:hypothetical protein
MFLILRAKQRKFKTDISMNGQEYIIRNDYFIFFETN